MKKFLLGLLATAFFAAATGTSRADQFTDIQNSPCTYWVPPSAGYAAPPAYGYYGPPPVYYYGPPPPPVPPPIPHFFIGFHFH